MDSGSEKRDKSSEDDTGTLPEAKRKYVSPRLVRYGDLARLTAGGVASGHDTGVGNPGTKV
jgi:hypothetical protein